MNQTRNIEDNHDEFTLQYVRTMLWAECNPDDETPLDDAFEPSDLSDEAWARVEADCKAFQEKAGELIEGRESDAGRDFWLTRNGHGCGFWDGDWEDDVGEKLTRLSKEFGKVTPFVNDDGKIYLLE